MAAISKASGDHTTKRRLYEEELPLELWIEIFFKSSAETLIRIKCVSTRWRALISSPSFTKKYLHLQKTISKTKGRFLLKHYEADTDVSNCFLFDEETVAKDATSSSSLNNNPLHSLARKAGSSLVFIEGPINGLYCVGVSDRIVIWNPSINEVGFPPFPSEYPSCIENICDVVFAFGIDPFNEEDYKVVLICSYGDDEIDDDDGGFCRMLYTTSTNTWRIIEDNGHEFAGEGCPDKYRSNNTYLNGIYYWLADREDDDDDCGVVLAFDMGKEVFQWIPTPFTFSSDCIGDIALLDEDIYLFIVNKNACQIDMWVLTFEENIWIKKNSFSGIQGVEKTLGFWKTNEELLLVTDNSRLSRSGYGQTVLYNTSTGEIRNIGPEGMVCLFKASFYYESLVSLSDGIMKFKGNQDSCLDIIWHFLSHEDERAAVQED